MNHTTAIETKELTKAYQNFVAVLVASHFTVTVANTDQLDEVMASLKKVKQVHQVQRIS